MKEKKFLLLSLLLVAISIFYTESMYSAAYYRDSFLVKPRCQNAFTSTKKRATNRTGDAWTVGLISSGEGRGTITRFWLEKSSGANVSSAVNVKQGTQVYRSAYASANNAQVRLTAENNNYNNKSYYVQFGWQPYTGY